MTTEKTAHRYVIVVLLCCLSIFGVVGISNAYSLFYAPMTEIWAVKRVSATLHVTIASLVTGFSTPIAVRIARKIGFRIIFILGVVLYLFAGITIGNSTNMLVINLAAVLKGIANSCVSMIFVTSIINNWFVEKRATVIGLVLSFSGLGGAVASPLLQEAISTFGFKTSFIGCQLLTCLLCAPFALFCPVKPEDVGLTPYGKMRKQEKEDSRSSDNLNLKLKLKSSLYVRLVVSAAAVTAILNIASHLPSFALEQGFDGQIAATQLSFVMIGNVLFKLLMGLLIDKLNVYVGYYAAMSLSITGAITIILNRTNPALYLFSGILYGACYSASTVCLLNLFSYIYSKESYVEAYSTSSLICGLCSSVIFTSVNLIYDIMNSYYLSFIILILLGAFGMIMVFSIRGTAKKLLQKSVN